MHGGSSLNHSFYFAFQGHMHSYLLCPTCFWVSKASANNYKFTKNNKWPHLSKNQLLTNNWIRPEAKANKKRSFFILLHRFSHRGTPKCRGHSEKWSSSSSQRFWRSHRSKHMDPTAYFASAVKEIHASQLYLWRYNHNLFKLFSHRGQWLYRTSTYENSAIAT